MDTLSIERPDVDRAFRTAMRRVASTVTIVTAADAGRRHGMTMTAVGSLSMDPPSMFVCVNQSSLLHDILQEGRRFCVNVLRHDQAGVSAAFSGGAPAGQRFAVGAWSRSEDGLDFLETAQACVFCKKAAALPFGTHTIFIGTVDEVVLNDDAQPLLYRNAAYCRPSAATQS